MNPAGEGRAIGSPLPLSIAPLTTVAGARGLRTTPRAVASPDTVEGGTSLLSRASCLSMSPLKPLPSWEQRPLFLLGAEPLSGPWWFLQRVLAADSAQCWGWGCLCRGSSRQRGLGHTSHPSAGPGRGRMAPFMAQPEILFGTHPSHEVPSHGQALGVVGEKHPLISFLFVQTHEPSWSRRVMPPAGKPQRRGGCPASVSFPAGVAGPARQMAQRLAEMSAGARSSWLHPYPGQEQRCRAAWGAHGRQMRQ